MGELRDRVRQKADEIKALAQTHHANDIMVFGSVARGDDRADSDIDFLVEFNPGASILDQVHLELELRTLLQCDVDVVPRGGLKHRDQHVLDEAVAL
ncbi:MAG: nucleotidyltransferase domain-containing protein [Actinobacteria bacterium]|nr:nucleotidyltransferase domain-containing protein [Actinomycetota bacterium]